MNVMIGTGPDSWGVWFGEDEKQTPWHRYLDEIVEAGYEWTELGPYGYLPTDFDTLKGELDKRNLKVSGTFAMEFLDDPEYWPSLEKQVMGAGENLAKLNAKYLVLIDNTYTNPFTGEPIKPATLDDDGWQRLIDTTNKVAELIKEKFGLTLVFHPHAETHVEYEDQIERFLVDTDKDIISICFDVGHHAYRKGDPVNFMRKHHERIPYLHLKSVDAELQKKVEEENIPFGEAVGMDMFCEPSKGAVDFIAFRDLLKEIDYEGFGIVEQDMYPAPFDKPLPIAKRTREYLKETGIG